MRNFFVNYGKTDPHEKAVMAGITGYSGFAAFVGCAVAADPPDRAVPAEAEDRERHASVRRRPQDPTRRTRREAERTEHRVAKQ